MRFIDELHSKHEEFTQYLKEHDSEDLFALPYAPYSNQIYLQFQRVLRSEYLADHSPLSRAMDQIGIVEPDERLALFICTHYLYIHAGDVV